MADYRDIGKVADDLFEPMADPPDRNEKKPELSLKEEVPETGDADSKLLDNIRRIREMVEADFRAIDESVKRSLEKPGAGGMTDAGDWIPSGGSNPLTGAESKRASGVDVPNGLSGTDSLNGLSGADPSNGLSGTDRDNPLIRQKKEPEEQSMPADPSPAGSVDTAADQQQVKPEKPAMEELDELIGLESIKKDVRELVSLMKARQLRQEQGLKTVPVSMHLVFSGNPGTGKTTVARILARLYKEIGALTGGQLIEVDRSSLVAGFVGQTAIRTQEKIQQALGGVLFIDEAYTLAKEGQDYGQEAIDTLLKGMEDHRDNLVVIVAGYTDLMKKFINSNPGLKSRFNKYMEFPDYSADELCSIFHLQCEKYEYVLSEEAEEKIRKHIEELEAKKGDNFANARDIRNLFEAIVTDQATRIAAMENPSAEDLKTILPEDMLDTLGEQP